MVNTILVGTDPRISPKHDARSGNEPYFFTHY